MGTVSPAIRTSETSARLSRPQRRPGSCALTRWLLPPTWQAADGDLKRFLQAEPVAELNAKLAKSGKDATLGLQVGDRLRRSTSCSRIPPPPTLQWEIWCAI
jgi:hypothetical protein